MMAYSGQQLVERTKARRMARLRALDQAIKLIGLVRNHSVGLRAEWDGNPYTDEEARKMIQKEYDTLYWQLCRRYDKLHRELFSG